MLPTSLVVRICEDAVPRAAHEAPKGGGRTETHDPRTVSADSRDHLEPSSLGLTDNVGLFDLGKVEIGVSDVVDQIRQHVRRSDGDDFKNLRVAVAYLTHLREVGGHDMPSR